MIESQKGRVRSNFNMLRQQVMDQAGAYGGTVAPNMDRLNQQEAEEMARVDQTYTLQAAQERRSRLAEARGLGETVAVPSAVVKSSAPAPGRGPRRAVGCRSPAA